MINRKFDQYFHIIYTADDKTRLKAFLKSKQVKLENKFSIYHAVNHNLILGPKPEFKDSNFVKKYQTLVFGSTHLKC